MWVCLCASTILNDAYVYSLDIRIYHNNIIRDQINSTIFSPLPLFPVLAISCVTLIERLNNPWHSVGQQRDTPLLRRWRWKSGCGLHPQAEVVQETGWDLFGWKIINCPAGQSTVCKFGDYGLSLASSPPPSPATTRFSMLHAEKHFSVQHLKIWEWPGEEVWLILIRWLWIFHDSCSFP